jgi:membrane dipeptidase
MSEHASWIADAHVDVLYRMEREGCDFYGPSPLHASAEKLLSAGVATQVFALFVSPNLPSDYQLEIVLRQIDLFYEHVVRDAVLRPVRALSDLHIARREGVIAGLLSLEGGGCLRGQPEMLRTLHRLGVRGIGLTWNDANELSDGCREPRGGGLTALGLDVVREAHRLRMWVDLSHLSDQGIADLFDCTSGPLMASHANCRSIHPHPRNLSDDVIRELFRREGWMGLVFEGSFVGSPPDVTVDRLLLHLDHVLRLGGEDYVGFGSDFDGLAHPIPGLSDAGDYRRFADLLEQRYGSALAEKILFQNFESFLQRTLSSSSSTSF